MLLSLSSKWFWSSVKRFKVEKQNYAMRDFGWNFSIYSYKFVVALAEQSVAILYIENVHQFL